MSCKSRRGGKDWHATETTLGNRLCSRACDAAQGQGGEVQPCFEGTEWQQRYEAQPLGVTIWDKVDVSVDVLAVLDSHQIRLYGAYLAIMAFCRVVAQIAELRKAMLFADEGVDIRAEVCGEGIEIVLRRCDEDSISG